MRDVLSTHRDVGLFGLRHRSWMLILLVIVVVQLLMSMGQSNENPLEGSLETFVKSVRNKRVALVMHLQKDHTKVLTKRFRKWNEKRFPCLNRREHHMMDIIFYMGPHAKVNAAVIEQEFSSTEARRCFREVKFMSASGKDSDAAEHMADETHAFYRLFDKTELKENYDVFMYMSPRVWQVKPGWADKIYEEAVVSDEFWVRGSAAMATCPKSALTADGDCDGTINLGFPAVLHINVNALYNLHSSEFANLRRRSESKYPHVAADVAMFKELVSTDHPMTSKLRKGGQRRPLAHENFHHRDDAPNVRHKTGDHVTSLYWPAHAHRFQYADFIVNALAGKKHFKEELQAGHHPNTHLVHQGLSE